MVLAVVALLLAVTAGAAEDAGWTHLGPDALRNSDQWIVAGDAALKADQPRLLVGKPGKGVLINGKVGKCPSLVTKQVFQDVELHVEFLVAKGSNSGVIFHGNHEIQILDSAHVKNPTGGHCGGVYPRAEAKPTYHHIDKGSPPRVNAALPPGKWQTFDIIFQAARFDKAGKKTAHARFVKVVHNGKVIQENVEVPYACGPNWDRKQHPRGAIILQGDYGPVAFRNLRVRPWKGAGGERKLNVPPEGFTALFNGKDFSGFHMSPRAKAMWTIEDGVLKAPKLLEQWGADLVTKGKYKDFVLLADFRMPKGSDSGIHFRQFIPDMGYFSQNEQINLGTGHRMGQVESFGYMRHKKLPIAKRLKPSEFPKVKQIAPEPDQWHTIKITMQGRMLSIEVDGETTLDKFVYPAWLLGDEPAPLRFQKHRFTDMGNGKRNPCPIEYRNLFIKEVKAGETAVERTLNVPPKGFAALFNGKDLTGWHTPPLVRKYWKIEDGVLKSPGLTTRWGACLATKKHYRDFVLMLDFRMPTISDSGINFRRLIPEIPGFGTQEQFNLRSRGGMGHLESYYFLPKPTAKKHGLKEAEKPHVRHIDPKVGVWHTVKLTVIGRTISAEYDGEVILDKFRYHDWMINMEPAPIRLQKHIVVHGQNLGKENPCPIEYRNIFIKDLGPERAAKPKRLQKPKRTPNIVVLLADDLGWGDIGCYGGPVKTPTLDRLAAEGVRFTNFYAGAAVCGPSRAVLLTGRHHARTGIYGNVIFESFQKPHLLEREVTLPEVLKMHGYATAHFGKWHLGMPTQDVKKPTPAKHGFDYWFGMNSGANPSHKDPVNFLRNGKPVGKIEGYSCQIVVDEAISWLDEKRDPEAPFFLNLWFHEPHDRVAAPESIVSQYGDLTDQAAVYSGTIDNTDRAIARLLDKLKEVDSLENTLIFYTSDNGSYRDDRNGNLRGRKASNFEGGIRVPGIFYWPGTIKGGHVERGPAGVVDLLPTICGLLGIDKPEGVHLDGSDISPLLTGRNNEFARHQPLYWHLPSGNPSLAIRDGNYSMVAYRDYVFPRDRAAIVQVEKEIEEVLRKANSPELVPWVERTDYFYKVFKNKDAERLRSKFMRLNVFQESWIPVLKSGSYKRFQLFDLAADPSQKVDVSKQYPEVFARLKRQLLDVNASVMAEAPDWGHNESSHSPAPPNAADAELAGLFDRIEKTDLPAGYAPGPKHQPYVDRRIAGLTPQQRARLGRLWKDKVRLHPQMPNRGKSFVRIMEYVAGGEK